MHMWVSGEIGCLTFQKNSPLEKLARIVGNPHHILIAFLFLAWIMSGVVQAKNNELSNQKFVLVTGFEPFGGEKTNGSWEAVQHLDGTVIADKQIVSYQLPVRWEKASEKLLGLIQEIHPVAVIAFGEAGAQAVRVEMVAKNFRDQYRDNSNKMPETNLISTSAPPSLRTTLNIDLITMRLQEASIPVTLSKDAGGYLCNETFFNLMNFSTADKLLNIRRGFIHVPPLNAKVISTDGAALLFNKAALERTADIVVRAAVEGL